MLLPTQTSLLSQSTPPSARLHHISKLQGYNASAFAAGIVCATQLERTLQRRALYKGHGRRSRQVATRQAASSLSSQSMAATKTVLFIRHGQAAHNVLYERGEVDECKALLDPPLTALGEEQARSVRGDPLLASKFDSLDLVVASPLRRTVQTALGTFRGWSAHGRRILLHPDLQETGEIPCDTGSPLEVLRNTFSDDWDLLDLELVMPGWEKKEGLYKDTGPTLRKRLDRFCEWLSTRPEENIAVVAHHNLFVALLGISFLNCEVRQYSFTNGLLTPDTPQVSRDDSELTETDIRHLKIHDPMARRKYDLWGFEAPPRFR